MNRRDFLKRSVGASAMLGLGSGLIPGLANALVPSGFDRTLINVMLLGGADLRFLFVPVPETPYAVKFWEARSGLYGSGYGTYTEVWDDLYLPVTNANGATLFGIHKRAAWLKDQFDLGNVAIVCNVLGSDNRRHDHSQLIMNTGDIKASQFIYEREGWGGRLAYAIDNANAVSVSRDISVFCKGLDPQNRTERVVHAYDSRNFGLSNGNGNPNSSSSALARALKSYYASKRLQVKRKSQSWPYHKFLQHEADLRAFGDTFNARLDVTPQPESLRALYTSGSGDRLNNSAFGLQCSSVYDSILSADLLKMRIASMEYTGWDTHNNEKNRFESNVEDIFGTDKGLDTLTQELESLDANERLEWHD